MVKTPSLPAAEVEAASTMDKKFINLQHSTRSALLKLPSEIKQKIWILAIVVDEPIEPVQVRERSNKFIWSKTQIDQNNLRRVIKNAPQLTVVELSQVCRTLYHEVSLTHLFYKFNHFKFEAESSYRVNRAIGPINYLVALTTPRLKSVRFISCDWPGVPKEASKLFTLLATCDNLQSLELIIHNDVIDFYPMTSFAKVPGFKYALIAVEGLQTLKLKVSDKVTNKTGLGGQRVRGQAMINKIELPLQEQMKRSRGSTKYNLEMLLAAQRDAKLDIHGDGRLGEDKRPGLVASRTRNQLRKLETIKDDGTIPERVLPKYDSDGDLVWHVEDILESRPFEPNGFPPSIEFKVKCQSLTGLHAWQRSELPVETSWEEVNVLENFRHLIVTFYQKNPCAYGKEAVVEAWNFRDQDNAKSAAELRHYRTLTSQIVKIAEREQMLEQLRAEAAAKESINAARQAKKAKKAKTMKESQSVRR